MQRRRPQPTSPVVSDTARVALRRALVGAPLLAIAAALVDLLLLRAVGPTDVLLGLALGLLAGPLTLAERAARLGRPWAALTWGAGVGVVGVLVAAVQAGFAARVLAQGSPAGAHAVVYADVWLAALDPTTVWVVVARALPFAVVPLLAWRRSALLLAVLVVVVLALLRPWAPPEAATDVVVHLSHGGAWGLPTGARATSLGDDEVRVASGFSMSPGATLVPVTRITALAAAFDLVALVIAVGLGNVLARRRPAPAGAARSRSLPLARLLPTLGVVAVAGLLLVRHRSPPTFLVAGLVDALDDEVRRPRARRLLDRLGPDDAGAVPVLAAKLGDTSSPRRRRFAALSLRRIGPPANLAALPALGRALGDANPEVLEAALDTVIEMGPAARPIAFNLVRVVLDARASLHDLDGGSWSRRAHEALARLGYEPTREDLVTLLQDPDGDVAAGAIRWLRRLGAFGPGSVPLLYDAAHRDGCTQVAVDVLAELGAPALALLRERLVAPDLHAKDPILRLLGRVGSAEEQLASFSLAARHPAADVRRATAQRLRGQGLPGAPALLAGLAVDADEAVRDEARRALATLGEGAAGPLAALIRARSSTETATFAVDALVLLGGAAEGALPALERALKDGEPPLREAVAGALGKIGPYATTDARASVVAALVLAARDPLVAGAAIDALRSFMSLDDPRVREALLAALDAPSADVRARAAVSLVLGTGATRTRGAPGLSALDPHLERLIAALVAALPHAEAYEALWTLGPRARAATPALVRAVEAGGDVSGALRALQAIGLDEPGALAAVGFALRKGRRVDRLQAIALLRAHGAGVSAILDDLVVALADPEPQVRRDVVITLDALDAGALARVRPKVEERLVVEQDAQASALLQGLLRRLDGAR